MNTDKTALDDLLLVPEIAKLLLISRAHAYELVRRGDIPSVRIGPRTTRVRRSSLERWIAEREANAGSVA